MGQYWKVINLDKRQTLGHWGKLGEFLFSPSPSWLVELLARPMEPLDTSTRGVNCVGSWAGDRIICVGDYIDDYPKCMLTKSETKVLRETNLCDFASEHYEELHPSGFTFPRSAAFSTDRIWILRNLSKRQYVAPMFSPLPVRGKSSDLLLTHPVLVMSSVHTSRGPRILLPR